VRKCPGAAVDVLERGERRVGRRDEDREKMLVLGVDVFVDLCNTVGGRLGFVVFILVDPTQVDVAAGILGWLG
jgi:hypothetical protein